MELQGMGQSRKIKPHPCRGLPPGHQNAKRPFPSGQAE